MIDLHDKVVLVTGGSSGIGEEVCYKAAEKGAIVIVCARRIQLIGQVKEKCKQLSGKDAYAFQLDIADPDSISRVSERILNEVGSVDILVNAAGFGYFEEFVSFDFEKARNMFEVNVLGMMMLTQKIASDMLENKSGHIINIASVAGKIATPKSTVYSATKFAVIGFSNALRLELKPFGIDVTTVNPGPVNTSFFDQADPSGNYIKKIGSLTLDVHKLAQKIVSNMEHPKREINKPLVMEVAYRFYVLFPRIGDYLAGGIFNKK